MNSRNRVQSVEGAYTPPNRVFIPPLRNTSTSSMQSAPAHIPAIRVASLGAGLAEPDLIRGAAICTICANRSDMPVRSARVITGTRPAHDTRLSSSNTAESTENLCETCTGSAFPNWVRLMRENINHRSSEGTFLISTPKYPPVCRWIQAKRLHIPHWIGAEHVGHDRELECAAHDRLRLTSHCRSMR